MASRRPTEASIPASGGDRSPADENLETPHHQEGRLTFDEKAFTDAEEARRSSRRRWYSLNAGTLEAGARKPLFIPMGGQFQDPEDDKTDEFDPQKFLIFLGGFKDRYMLLVGLVIGLVIGMSTFGAKIPALDIMDSLSQNMSTWLVTGITWACVPYHFWGNRVKPVRFLLNCAFFIFLNNLLGSITTGAMFYFMVNQFGDGLALGEHIIPPSSIYPGVVNSQDWINNLLQKYVPYSLTSAFYVTLKTALTESARVNCTKNRMDLCLANDHQIQVGQQIRYTASLVLAVVVGQAIGKLSKARKEYKGSGQLVIKQTWKAFFLVMVKLAQVYMIFLPVISSVDIIQLVQSVSLSNMVASRNFLYATLAAMVLYSLLFIPSIHFAFAGRNPYTVMLANPVLLFVSFFCPNFTSSVVAVFWFYSKKNEPVRLVVAKTVIFLIVGFFAKTGTICIASAIWAYQVLRLRPLSVRDIWETAAWTFCNTSVFLSEAEGGLEYVHVLPIFIRPGKDSENTVMRKVTWYSTGWGPLLEKIGMVLTTMHLILITDGADEVFPGQKFIGSRKLTGTQQKKSTVDFNKVPK